MKSIYYREQKHICGKSYVTAPYMEVDLYPVTQKQHKAGRRAKWYEAQVKIEYQYGNLKSTVPEKIARKKIKRVHSNGGWSLMDYWIET